MGGADTDGMPGEIIVAEGDETLSYTEPTDAWWEELVQVVGELELIKLRSREQRQDP